MNSDTIHELVRVTLGQEPADLVIVNARIVNVYTREILDNWSVSVKGERIAYVGPDARHTIGPSTQILDAEGNTLIPGLIDGHAHIAWLYSVGEFLKYAMTGGTTAIITETAETFAVMGYDGVVEFLESLKHQPIKFFGTAPPLISISQTAFGISEETLAKLLDRDDIVGLGESYWQGVFQHPERVFPVFAQTVKAGKTLEGHSAGAKGGKLAAYVAAGISSCHEPIQPNEVIERLRLGLYVMIREGSIRRDLEAISVIKDRGIDLRRLILVTDGIEPGDLMEKGYMEYIVQKAIDCGFDPATAIQMATLNVAEHFHLDDRMGAIAPGKYADMVMIPNERTIRAQYVISSGRIIARNQKIEVLPRHHEFSPSALNSVKIPKALEPSDWVVRVRRTAEEDRQMAEVRVIDMVTDLVTAETSVMLPVIQDEIQCDRNQGVIKVAAVDRTHQPGRLFTGFIKNFGLKSGAMACSAAWDTSCIIVVGADESDMAAAVNRIRELQGGAVICDKGAVLEELPMPIFGLISNLPAETLFQKTQALRKAAQGLGVRFRDPLLTLLTLTGAAIPYLRICEEGLVNLKNGKTVGVELN